MSQERHIKGQWYTTAHELDLKRRNQLRTIGYLSSEVRKQIWDDIADRYAVRGPRGYLWFHYHQLPTSMTYETLFDSVFDPPQNAMSFQSFDQAVIRNLRQACPTFDYLLLSTRSFLFDYPRALQQFLEVVQEKSALPVTIIIDFRAMDGWSDSLHLLLGAVKSIAFLLPLDDSSKESEIHGNPHIRSYYILNRLANLAVLIRAIRKTKPNILMSVCEDTVSDEHSTEEQRAVRKAAIDRFKTRWAIG